MTQNLKEKIDQLLEAMLGVSDEDRLGVFSEIKSNFCHNCGRRQDDATRAGGGRWCQCNNDE